MAVESIPARPTTTSAPAGEAGLHSTPRRPSPLANLRDLGGIAVDGGVTRHDVLWRSDDVALATPEQVADLLAKGLRTVVDLRSHEEVAAVGRGPLGGSDVEHHHVCLLPRGGTPSGLVAQLTSAMLTSAEMGRWYAQVLLAGAPLLAGAVRVLADSPGVALFHCAAGKDRTGILAACVLSLVGAPRDAVVADYAATGPRMPAVLARLGRPDVPEPAAVLLEAAPATMTEMLDVLDHEHGGIPAVLHAAGLRPETRERLRTRLVAA